MKHTPTLYEWAGKNEALEKLTAAFYEKVSRDPIISHIFKNMAADHSKHIAHFIGEVFGGPELYTKSDNGSHYKMIAHHFNKHLTEDQRKRWMTLLLESCDELGIASDPEFRSALVAYLEWGSRLALINSNAKQIDIKEGEPMPKWGWGETGGPYLP
jgi:hemoglobin